MAANKIKGLTIAINGETTGLDKALSGVNRKSKDLQTELRSVEKLLKLDPSNTELLGQKQKLLADSVQSAKEKLDTLKTAAEQAQDKLANGEIGDDQFRALQREIITAEKNLENLEDQSKEFGSVFSEQVRQAGTKVQEFGGKLKGVGEGLTKGVTAPIAGIAAASQVAFNEVDAALDTIVTKTGASGNALDGLNQSFKNVYGTLPVDAQKAGDAIGEVNTQFGLTGAALDEAAEKAIKFSEINGQDVSATAIQSKEAIEAFKLGTSDLGTVLDSVTKTAQNTGVATDKIFDSVVKGAPQLKAMGLDFSTSAEVMGRFEQKGVDSTKALSYLSKAQVTFAKDGKTLSDGLGGLIAQIANSSSETDKLTLASEYFGTKGATFMLDAIQRGALNFDDFKNAATDAAGAVDSTFEGTLDPVDKATVAMNNLKLAGTDISSAIQEALAPTLQALADKLQSLAQWFSGLDDQTKTTIITIAAIAAAVGPVIVVVAQLITSVGIIMEVLPKVKGAITAVNAAMAANPILAVVAVIAILVTALITLWNTNEGFRSAVIAAWDAVKSAIGTAIDAVKGFFAALGTKISEVWNSITTTISTAIDKIKNFFTVSVPGAINTMVSFFTGIPGRIWDELLKAIGKIQEWGQKISDWAKQNLPAPIATIVSFFATLPGKLLEIGANLVSGLWNGIWSKIEWVKSKITGFVDTVKSWFTRREAFDTHSPSKWAQGIGEFVTQGLANGILNMQGVALSAAKTVVDSTKKVFDGIQYDPNTDYMALINAAKEAGDLTKAADLEKTRNAKIGGEGLDWAKTFDFSALTDAVTTLADNINYAVSPLEDTSTTSEPSIAEIVGQALLSGLTEIGDKIFDAIPKQATFELNGRQMARASWDDYDLEGRRRSRIYAPSREQIASIAMSVMPKTT